MTKTESVICSLSRSSSSSGGGGSSSRSSSSLSPSSSSGAPNVLDLLDRHQQEEQEPLSRGMCIMVQSSLPGGLDIDLFAVLGARTGDLRFS
jgi:hypothetical protein